MSRRDAYQQGYEDEQKGKTDQNRYRKDYDYNSGVMHAWKEDRAHREQDLQADMDRWHDRLYDSSYDTSSSSPSPSTSSDPSQSTAPSGFSFWSPPLWLRIVGLVLSFMMLLSLCASMDGALPDLVRSIFGLAAP
jgi:hypothetical protein